MTQPFDPASRPLFLPAKADADGGPAYDWSGIPVRAVPPQPSLPLIPEVADGLGVSMAQFIASVSKEPDDLIPGMIPSRGLVVIGGEPRTFKTFLATQMLLAVATGSPFLGRTPARTGSVLYVSEEGAHAKVAERFQRASESFPPTSNVRILHRAGTTLEDETAWRRVTDTLDSMDRPALVVLDTLAALSTGDENAAKDMTMALRGPKAIVAKYGVTVVILHHTSKNGEGRNGKKLRGSSALWGALDSLLFMTRDSGDADTGVIDVEPKDGDKERLRFSWSRETFLVTLGGRAPTSTTQLLEVVESIGGDDWVTSAELQDRLGLGKSRTNTLLNQAVVDDLIETNGKGGPATAYRVVRRVEPPVD